MTAIAAAEGTRPTPSISRGLPTDANGRSPSYPVDPLFLHRWSPRAFTAEAVTEEEARSLFEAARWAPSASNEQPWLFLYARTPEDRARFLPGLVEFNQMWAKDAPLLVFLFARKFARNGEEPDRPNPTAKFDAGAAWMSFALQAELLGLSAHAMGGIDPERIYAITGVPASRYDVVAAVAVGHRGSPAQLAPMFAAREQPSSRLPQDQIVAEGRFQGTAEGERAVP